MKNKTKTVLITFLSYYSKASGFAGDPTLFEDKIITGKKQHTIRANYAYWAARIDAAHQVAGSTYSLRTWSDQPYTSKMRHIINGDASNLWYMSIQFNKLDDDILLINGKEYSLELVATLDGLTAAIFRDWFKSFVDDDTSSIIIGWGDNPYK
jgi:hypothetical protein